MNAPSYPLTMAYSLPVMGNGFLAGVSFQGRLLVETDPDGEVWAYGVNPGGLCASGANVEAALSAFTDRFNSCVRDMAEVAKTFEEFRQELSELFQTNDPYAAMWADARQKVREGSADMPGMRRETSVVEPAIRIDQIMACVPSHNVSREVRLAAAPAPAPAPTARRVAS